jgi:hypothetical protein
MANSPDNDPYEQWRKDSSTLHEIGRYLSREAHPVRVRLPRRLTDEAISAWLRDDGETIPVAETQEQYRIRSAAATLALIGLALENGFDESGDELVFELDAWQVGAALEAADNAGSTEVEGEEF